MASNLDNHEGVPHVLAIPFSTQGHMTPMLRFATQLARKGITISFVCFEDAIPGLNSVRHYAQTSASLDMFNVLKEAFQPVMKTFIQDKSAGTAGPTCIISDMFLTWTLDVAEKLQIPRYVLVTSGVIFARFLQGCIDYFEHGQFEISETDGRLVEFDWLVRISGLPPLRYFELDVAIHNVPVLFRECAESVMKSAGVLVNSFFELEEKVVEVLRSPGPPGYQQIKLFKIYPVGPLFSTTVLTGSTSVHGLEDSSSRSLRWLGPRPSSSVLYVAFGSEAAFVQSR